VPIYSALQGFTVDAPIPSKSLVFRVTIVSSYASAVAAINESTAGKGLPVRDVCDRREAASRYPPVYRKYAPGKPRLEISREPLLELCAAFTWCKQFDSLLNFRQRNDTHILRSAIRCF
jgi:hypothetical protein